MTTFRDRKNHLSALLADPESPIFPPDLEAPGGEAWLHPLLALLPRGGLLARRAALALGKCAAALADRNGGKAHDFVRRLLWRLNDESGNLGWGVPEALGEILRHSPALAEKFHRVFFSYAWKVREDDNFIAHPPLLRACLQGIGRLLETRPDYGPKALPALLQNLACPDPSTRAQAALALHKLFSEQKSAPFPELCRIFPLILPLTKDHGHCEDFDGQKILQRRVDALAKNILRHLRSILSQQHF